MGDQPDGASSGIGKVRNPRKRVLVTAKITGSFGEVSARILDLSDTGALIDADTDLAVGDEVQLVRGELSVRSHVVWVRTRRAGLHFLTTMVAQEFLAHSPAAAPAESHFRIEPMPLLSRAQERNLTNIWKPR